MFLVCLPLVLFRHAVIVPVACQTVGILSPSTLYDFESPLTSNYILNPAINGTVQPWTWTSGQGGVARVGGTFTAPAPSQAPSGSQYAVFWLSPDNALNSQESNLMAVLGNLSTSTSYQVSFYLAAATRYTSSSDCQMTVMVGGATVWQSPPDYSDGYGWVLVQSSPFMVSNASVVLQITVVGDQVLDRALLLDALTVVPTSVLSAPTMFPSIVYDFEAPVVSDYVTNPAVNSSTGGLQPFTWTYDLGGVARLGGTFIPPAPTTPPSGSQYAFFWTSPGNAAARSTCQMSAVLGELSVGVTYSVSFYLATATRYTASSDCQLTVTSGGMTIWQSPGNYSDSYGWVLVQSSPFTATSVSTQLVLTVTSSFVLDRALLVDSLIVAPVGLSPPAIFPNVLYDFEYPRVSDYAINPPLNGSAQPFTWTYDLGGIATSGTFVAPSPSTPPSGSQYAVFWTSPGNAVNRNISAMYAVLGNLSTSTSYQVSFYLAAATRYTSSSDCQMTVMVGGATVWQSPPDYSDGYGWVLVQSSPFMVSNASVVLQITVVGDQVLDRALLLDALTVVPTSVLSAPTMFPSIVYDFEAPVVSDYVTNPAVNSSTGGLQPFTWTYDLGGVARLGGTFIPPAPTTPPSGSQYAFFWTSPGNAAARSTCQMSAVLGELSVGVTYSVSFYLATATRYTASSDCQLTVTSGGMTIWQSPGNYSDSYGWVLVQSSPFTATSVSTQLVLTVTSSFVLDRALLVDSLIVAPVGLSPPAIFPNVLYDFEYPRVSDYAINPPLNGSAQPFTWTYDLGGIATSGTFVAPSPSTPPSGSQYAVFWTSPGNAVNRNISAMYAVLGNLSTSTSYQVSFYLAAATRYTSSSDCQMTVMVGGATVWQSPPDYSDGYGWVLVQSSPFMVSNASVVLQITVVGDQVLDRALLLDALTVVPTSVLSAPTMFPSIVYDFEAPVVSDYVTNPAVNSSTGGLQPFTWTYDLGGVARLGGTFIPPAPTTPPSGSQYAFFWTSPGNAAARSTCQMSAVLGELSVGVTYSVSFYLATATRYTASSDCQLTVTSGGMTIWQSPGNYSDSYGWVLVQSSPFTATSVSTQLVLTVTSSFVLDRALLVDSLIVAPVGLSPPAIFPNVLYDFEYPRVSDYAINPPLNGSAQPFTWTYDLGGIATSGTFVAPSPSTPPSGSQYAVFWTSPGNAVNRNISAMYAVLGNLSTSTSYQVSFYLAAATRYTSSSDCQMTVMVGGATVWQSPPDYSDGYGWVLVQSSPFMVSNASVVLQITVVGDQVLDRALLLDALTVVPTSVLSAPTMFPSIVYDFEAPATSNYATNPALNGSVQPWTWTFEQGGVAGIGGSFVPSAPSLPPTGTQYAYLRTSPSGAVGRRTCSLSAVVGGLASGSPYYIKFSYAVATATSSQAIASLSLQVGNSTVWNAQLSTSQTWSAVYSPTFQVYSTNLSLSATSGLSFVVQSSSDSTVVVLIDAVALLPGPAQSPVESVQTYNGHSYRLSPVASDWLRLDALSKASGWHLVTVDDYAEHEWLLQTFIASVPGFELSPLWIGLVRDCPTCSTFHWTDGSLSNFTYWSYAQPDNANGAEWYTVMHNVAPGGTQQEGLNGAWDDLPLQGGINQSPQVIDGPYFGIFELDWANATTVPAIAHLHTTAPVAGLTFDRPPSAAALATSGSNFTWLSTYGGISGVASFDGITNFINLTSYVESSNTTAYRESTGGAMSFEGWVQWQSFSQTYSRWFDIGGSHGVNGPGASDNEVAIYHASTSSTMEVTLYTANPPSEGQVSTAVPNALRTGVWYHVVIVIAVNNATADTTSSSSATLTVYFNSTQQIAASTYLPQYVPRPNAFLGRSLWEYDGDQRFQGLMHGFYQYDYTLSQEAVQAHFVLPRPPVYELVFATDPRTDDWASLVPSASFSYCWLAQDGRHYGVLRLSSVEQQYVDLNAASGTHALGTLIPATIGGVGYSGNSALSAGFSIEVTVSALFAQANTSLLSCSDTSGEDGIVVGWDATAASLVLTLNSSRGGDVAVPLITSVQVGVFYHVGIVLQSSTQQAVVQVYVNGQLTTSQIVMSTAYPAARDSVALLPWH